MQKCEWIIELEPGVWLAEGEGDPPRTLDFTKSRGFPSLRSAKAGLKRAREYRPFLFATIDPV